MSRKSTVLIEIDELKEKLSNPTELFVRSGIHAIHAKE
jgi:hypothetical protein